MNLVTVENISKSYGDKLLFDHITFGIQEGDKIGLIGVNGTGKSTFLKIIAGMVDSDEGRRMVNKQIHIEYLPQNPEFRQQTTVLEEVFYGDNPKLKLVHNYEKILRNLKENPKNEKLQEQLADLGHQMDMEGAWELEANAKAILTKLGIDDFSMPINALSGGLKKRVAMARSLIQPADLLILDEPTNHIDNETIEWLEEYFKKWKGALLLITHDRYFLNRVVNRIIELDYGKLYNYEGNYETFLEKKAEREELMASKEKKHDNLMRRELAWIRRGARARSTKQKARIQRFEALQREVFQTGEEKLEIGLEIRRLGKKVLELKNLSKSFGSKKLINQFSYVFMPGERIGIIGKNGSGKSTLLNLIAGKLQPDSGEVEIGQTVKFAYYDQESKDLDPNMRVIDYIKEGGEYIALEDGTRVSASQMLERFLFPPNVQWTPITMLSGGEKRRLYLLRKLMESPNVLLLDEPTNDLDIKTLTILEDYLDKFPGTVIIVSHDRYFLDRTVDHLFVFEEPGQIRVYPGNYSDYLSRYKENKVNIIEEDKPQDKDGSFKKAIQAKENEKIKKLSYKDQREYDEIEEIIKNLENQLKELEFKIEQTTDDYVMLQQYLEEQKAVEDQLTMKLERWMELSEMVEEIERNKEGK